MTISGNRSPARRVGDGFTGAWVKVEYGPLLVRKILEAYIPMRVIQYIPFYIYRLLSLSCERLAVIRW